MVRGKQVYAEVAECVHRQNSLKAIRRKVEDKMDLEEGVLDEAPYKSAVKDVVQNYIVSYRSASGRLLSDYWTSFRQRTMKETLRTTESKGQLHQGRARKPVPLRLRSANLRNLASLDRLPPRQKTTVLL